MLAMLSILFLDIKDDMSVLSYADKSGPVLRCALRSTGFVQIKVWISGLLVHPRKLGGCFVWVGAG